MTDRDTFAAAALTGIIANEGEGGNLPGTCAYAYRIADAMLRERGAAVSDNCVTGNQREMEYPQHSLTSEELEAIEWFSRLSYGDGGRLPTYCATLRALLERTK